MVDDDPEDIFLTRRAFMGIGWSGQFESVGSATEMYDRLGLSGHGASATARDGSAVIPDIIILDLNMPGINGFEALERIGKESGLAHLPVVVLSTSQADSDVQKAYSLGANSFISKPVSNEGMTRLAERFRDYWFELSRLPAVGTG